MDRRQKKTKEAIYKAFEELVTQKSYQKITVQEIIDRANVGRTTFYAHFETKDALLREICAGLFHHVFYAKGAGAAHNFSLSQGDSHTVVIHMLCHLRDNRNIISRLMTGESSEMFLFYFKQNLNRLVDECLLSGIRCCNEKVSEAFLRNHVSGSFVNMVQWWIQNGMQESPEELGESFLAVIEPIL